LIPVAIRVASSYESAAGLASFSARKYVVKQRKTRLNSSMNKKKIRNDVTTGNAAKVAAIALFLFLCCDNNLGKRDYNPDKQHQQPEFWAERPDNIDAVYGYPCHSHKRAKKGAIYGKLETEEEQII
jgi:hypothetical protein